MNKAIFLDRDGTINLDSNHVFDPEKLFLLDGASLAISLARNSGFKIIVVTNQSCIGRGYASYQQVNSTHGKMRELLLEESPDATIDLILTAPDHPDAPTARRKPGPGMIYEAAENLDLDLQNCWIIGDKITDPQAGESAGIPLSHCILIHSNRTADKIPDLESQKYQVFTGILEAVKHITS